MAPSLPPYARPTLSSQSRRQIQSNRSSLLDESTATSEIQTGSSVRLSATTAPSTTSSGRRQSVKNATVRDADFEDTQLAPRGINIERQQDIGLGASAGAYAYFASDPPPDLAQSREFYKSKVQHSLAGKVDRDIDDSIFLPVDDDFVQSVQRAYCSLGEAKLPESEYKAYACQDLFVGQYVLLAKDTTRQLCAVRSVEWSLKPEPKSVVYAWHTPPIVPPDHPPLKPFNFDIEPDCQFWLCDKILNADYRQNINIVVHSKPLGAFCPYFSIEFKARTDDQWVVLNQVAAAGSASLYNRYQLKLNAYPRPTHKQWELVRHFGLTMERENWKMWLFEPKIEEEASWAGCNIRNICSGTCTSEQGVRKLLSWINEVHRWGLCEYAPGCEDDIKHVILSKDPNKPRMSGVGFSEE